MKQQTWYEKLGYKENPFTIKPFAFEKELAGYKGQIRKVNASIRRGRVIFIEGEYGIGKTSVVKQVINEFKGKGKLIYYSANRAEGGIDFDGLIKGRANMFQKIFGIIPKKNILIIDEAQKITLNDSKKIEELIETGYFRSVVLVSDSFAKVNMTQSLRRMIGDKILRLGDAMNENIALRLVRARLGGGQKFLAPKIVRLVFEKANRNPRKMLEYLEDISRYVVEEKGRNKITEEDVTYVLA